MLGLAGTIPYLSTSLVTLFCAWDLNHAAHHNGTGYIISPDTAFQLLSFLGPIQVGWGALVRYVSLMLTTISNMDTLDLVILKCHSLGPRICRLWRLPLLQALCHRRCRPSVCMVNHHAQSGMGLGSSVPGLHNALLY